MKIDNEQTFLKLTFKSAKQTRIRLEWMKAKVDDLKTCILELLMAGRLTATRLWFGFLVLLSLLFSKII